MNHIIKAQQFDRKFIEEIFKLADEMESVKNSDILKGKIICSLFYEESTRTRFSFESAALRLGANVISTENAKQFSSVSKGETLEHTIKVINNYADLIVLRHYEIGSAEKAANVSRIPIINAGDGAGQHPTQALLDLYTIKKELGKIDGISIVMIGDLAYGRTVRSLAYLLAKFNDVKIYFVAHDVVKIKDDIKDYLKRHSVFFKEESDLKKVIKEVDVVYQTRIQKERFNDVKEYEKAKNTYILDNKTVSLMKENSIIMHPMPIAGEIKEEVDNNKKAVYFRQAGNAVPIRMALLKMMLT